MKAIEKAVGHFKSLKRLKVEVPEWGDADHPMVMYIPPLTVEDINQIHVMMNDKDSFAERAAYFMIFKCRDGEDKRIFSNNDKEMLTHSVDANIIMRIMNQIEAFAMSSIEEQVGNSATTPSAIGS